MPMMLMLVTNYSLDVLFLPLLSSLPFIPFHTTLPSPFPLPSRYPHFITSPVFPSTHPLSGRSNKT
jgi:hypothetical protein